MEKTCFNKLKLLHDDPVLQVRRFYGMEYIALVSRRRAYICGASLLILISLIVMLAMQKTQKRVSKGKYMMLGWWTMYTTKKILFYAHLWVQ